MRIRGQSRNIPTFETTGRFNGTTTGRARTLFRVSRTRVMRALRPLRPRSRGECLQPGSAEELFDSRTTAEAEPHGPGRRLEAQFEPQEWTATTLQHEPIQGVLQQPRLRVETRRIAVVRLANLAEFGSHTS